MNEQRVLMARDICGRIGLFPAADRREIVAQAIALQVGAKPTKANPTAVQLAAEKVSLADVVLSLSIPNAAAAFTSSDLQNAVGQSLPIIADNIMREMGPPEHRALCADLEARDFKDSPVPRTDPIDIEPVGQSSEIKAVKLRVGWPSIKIMTGGGIAPFSRQAVINAQWDLLRATTFELIDGAYRSERTAVVAVLETTAALDDGLPLFDLLRDNLKTAASVAGAIEAGIGALRGLVATNGSPLNLAAGVLAVPALGEVEARRALALAGLELPVVADSRFTAVYVLPRPTLRPVVGLAHIGKARAPVTDLNFGFHDDAWSIRVRHDFAAAALSPYAVKVEVTA